jgi:hypothetical protein
VFISILIPPFLFDTYYIAYFIKYFMTLPLWGDWFFSKIIGTLRAFLKVFDYICQNPVKAGLVGRAEWWEFGGVCHFKKGEIGVLDLPPLVKAVYEAICEH